MKDDKNFSLGSSTQKYEFKLQIKGKQEEKIFQTGKHD